MDTFEGHRQFGLHPGERQCGAGARELGAVAQLAERIVRNDEVVGSTPIRSTSPPHFPAAATRSSDRVALFLHLSF